MQAVINIPRCISKTATSARRRGSLMIEMVVCTVLLSVVTAVLVPGIYAIHNQRKAARYDALAVIELNNQMALATEKSNEEEPKLTEWFAKRYPEATLSVKKVDSGDEILTAVRFTIVRPLAEAVPPVERSLVAWGPKADDGAAAGAEDAVDKEGEATE